MYFTDSDSSDSYDSDTDDSLIIDSDDSDNEDIIYDIENYEDSIEYVLPTDQKYYIGTYKYIRKENILLFAKRIQLSTFYKYNGYDISCYLYWYSGIYISHFPTIEIMQLITSNDNIYTAVLKTFWIKIIQRTWKNVYQKRKQYILKMKKSILSFLYINEIKNEPIQLPGLKGMLSIYQTSINKEID